MHSFFVVKGWRNSRSKCEQRVGGDDKEFRVQLGRIFQISILSSLLVEEKKKQGKKKKRARFRSSLQNKKCILSFLQYKGIRCQNNEMRNVHPSIGICKFKFKSDVNQLFLCQMTFGGVGHSGAPGIFQLLLYLTCQSVAKMIIGSLESVFRSKNPRLASHCTDTRRREGFGRNHKLILNSA